MAIQQYLVDEGCLRSLETWLIGGAAAGAHFLLASHGKLPIDEVGVAAVVSIDVHIWVVVSLDWLMSEDGNVAHGGLAMEPFVFPR